MTSGPLELEGILLVDKPKEHTSHDVIARLRKKLQMKRIGHAGTLDPMATGLLVVLLGKATKASQYITSLDKEYTGEITLGVVTNSQDADGEIMSTAPVPDLTEDALLRHMKTFVGDQYQMPPMHSAIKIDGVPLYKLAHKGKEIEREPRFIRIDRFDLLRYAKPVIEFRLLCSKGTYVRTVAHDLGAKIGCGAHLSVLRRTSTDKFRIEEAITLDEILALPVREIGARLIPVRDAIPRVIL
jgi:tRNA pseudouridine55 synthase